jgi:hypothetical protein
LNDTYSTLEEFIKKFYQGIGIFHPHQLNIEAIATRIELVVNYYDGSSMYAFNQFFLNQQLSDEEIWEDFGHEMCHGLWHSGNQRFLSPSFIQYQEWKANNFMYEFCVPEFMLWKFMIESENHPINQIIDNFQVTPEFARIRYERYMKKQYQQQLNAAFKERMK